MDSGLILQLLLSTATSASSITVSPQFNYTTFVSNISTVAFNCTGAGSVLFWIVDGNAHYTQPVLQRGIRTLLLTAASGIIPSDPNCTFPRTCISMVDLTGPYSNEGQQITVINQGVPIQFIFFAVNGAGNGEKTVFLYLSSKAVLSSTTTFGFDYNNRNLSLNHNLSLCNFYPHRFKLTSLEPKISVRSILRSTDKSNNPSSLSCTIVDLNRVFTRFSAEKLRSAVQELIAGDSVTNLHVALDRFKDQVEHLHGMKWRQYTVKIFMCGDYEFLSKMYGLSGASGCYPCLFCIIGSDEMATPLSIRGYATRRTLETMCSDHQHYVAAGSIRRDAQKFFNSISLPIFNIPVSQVCPPGLHITLGIFTKLFHLLEAACHQLDLELALHITDFTGPSSSFSKYSQELQNLSFLQAELEKAQQSHEELQNMATYMALVNGEKSPLAVKLVKQSAAKMKSVKALQLDSALQLIGVQRQQYFGGAFVGNHVHKALKLPNVKTLCTAISQMAQEKLPHQSGEVAENMKNFINLFSLFGKCHNISDQNFLMSHRSMH
ncbi:hypothetical protein EMCRGX_G009717 [Ephydatia muelleri]